MPSSYSVIHRYTPPTCTLEILAKKPLFPWQRLSVEKRFELRFDDPKLSQEQPITLRGDRAQLEHLSDVVSQYIQEFLEQSPNRLSLHLAQVPQISVGLPDSEETVTATIASPLQAKSLLAHELCLDSFAVEATDNPVKLSTLQLFDLAEALEGSIQIASPQPPQHQSRKLAIVGVGAAVVLLAVALPIGWKFFDSRTEDESVTLQEIETQPPEPSVQLIPPLPPVSTEVPETSPSLPPPLVSEERLPPPPPVDVPSASESLPTPPKVTVLPTPTPKPSPSTTLLPNQPAPPTTTPIIPRQSASSSEQLAAQNSDSPKFPEVSALQSEPADVEITLDGTAIAKAPGSARIDSSAPTPANLERGDSLSRTALNTIPQLSEVRAYFQKVWQPPTSLEETLEYRLVLNRDGSIKRIVPIGQAARVYLDRTSMPLMGESFVSPLASSEAAPQIRVFLNPDGTVRTFLES